ncbi:DUF5686 family protein [Cnuella takakiae]|uniref:DUF5686 family protein n=1 Tax=Cnuella takakiae TaxID=1302690 RepID=UPI001FE4994A|nr:DUF5686 family protein [Cnuella takakiae]
MAQKVIKGNIREAQSGETIPFASIRFKASGSGMLADSAGSFMLRLSQWPKDTLEITSVGFQDYRYFVDPAQVVGDTLFLNIRMIEGRFNTGVTVRAKGNRGLWMWRRIVQHKAQNDRYRFRNFGYELYNKLELDIKNVNKEKLSDSRMLRKFQFIFDQIDTSEGAAYLPAYLTEALSDYYYSKEPLRRREVFKATKTLGFKNESVSKLLGGMDQNVNFYNNFIPVFDKQFVSPISDNGDAYYTYKIADTQYVAGRRLVHFFFTPKRKGENTFEGDCWVQDTSFAIQKMNLRLSKEANINFLHKMNLIQEYQLINDSTWFLSRDKWVIDVAPFGKNNLSFIGRKTTTYRNVVVNDAYVDAELAKNKVLEESVLPEVAAEKPDSFWIESRHEELTKSEQGIYNMVDSLMNMPQYKTYRNTLYFLTVGYKNIGNYEIGPWFNWLSYNSYEGFRTRFDLGTNTRFSKQVYLHGYLAYGFTDRQVKFQADGRYLFKRNPRRQLYLSWRRDIDFGQNYYGDITQDNIFALAIRKQGVPIKFISIEDKRAEYTHGWRNGFAVSLSGVHKTFNPLRNLPPKEQFLKDPQADLSTFEAGVRIRYAYLERFLESTFSRISLGSVYPIVDFRYTRGISGVGNSGYDYSRLFLSVSDYAKVAPLGNIYYNLFAGRTYGNLPYILLDVAPGNEIYYYNRNAFNLMNRYEYIQDRYAGAFFEHNYGTGLFRFLPITRKLKLRQLWTAKALWGGLSEANKGLNFTTGHPFRSLDGKTYLELGTGVDNILKVLRLDFVWKILPWEVNTAAHPRFGAFASFKVNF